MITQEQINEAASNYGRQAAAELGFVVESWIGILTDPEQRAFIAGATWMQEQQRWIPVEEDGKLPELDEDVLRRAAGYSKRVIVLIDGYEHFATYAYSIDDWLCDTYCGTSTPSHWTYLPPKP